MTISGIMAPKNKNAAIKAFNRILLNESLDNEHSDGSNEVPNIRIDPEAGVPQTRAAAVKAARTPIQVESTSQSDEEGSEHGPESVESPKTGKLPSL